MYIEVTYPQKHCPWKRHQGVCVAVRGLCAEVTTRSGAALMDVRTLDPDPRTVDVHHQANRIAQVALPYQEVENAP